MLSLIHIFIYSERILNKVEGVDFVHLTKKDVVRNPLVQRIIEAYETYETKKQRD